MESAVEYVSHPFIKPRTVERRSYQIAIAATCLMRNTLVILPTGLGKTVIALLVIASRLLNEDGKVLFLAPTKPLVEQHADFLRRTLNIDAEKIVTLSGEVPPEKREELYERATIVVSTPQVVENDIISGRVNLRDFILAIFDEAHRAVGNYSYVFIAKQFRTESKSPLIMGITASPGSEPERILEVIENLGIEDMEIRTEYDSDVRPYVGEKKIEWVKVDMPEELKEVAEKFQEVLKLRFKRLKNLNVFENVDFDKLTKKELLALQEALQAEAAETGESKYFEALSTLAEILKVQHGIELIETQGLDALKHYLRRLVVEGRSKGGSKASKSLISDPLFRSAVLKALNCKADHPKLEKLKEVVSKQLRENPDSRIIVFTNFRDTADTLLAELNSLEGVKAAKFIGQANRGGDKGMRQREQVEILQKFREGELNVLVSTSVGEEGLDIPSTDLVVFYEAVPSEIRAIQRRGRTGRGREGRIVVLITKGTRDEAYYWASVRKERAMYDRLYEVRDRLKALAAEREHRQRGQKSLEDFIEASEISEIRHRYIIYADSREAKGGVVRILHSMGFDVKLQNLEVADFVVSDRVAIERKSVDDFLESLINRQRDLFGQLINLRKSYSRPLLIIEGENLYGRRNVHPNAVRGAIASIVVDLSIPVIFTRDARETAELIAAIARREQELKDREIALHTGKTKMTLKEQMEYIVSAISDIGPVIARNLLEHFGTIQAIANASEEELMKVPKVGKKTAEKIRRLMTTPYHDADKITLE